MYGDTRKHFPPFQIRLGAQYDFGPQGQSHALLKALGLPAHGSDSTRLSQAMSALRREWVIDPISRIITTGAAIALTGRQLDSLATLSAAYQRETDALLAPLALFVVSAGPRLGDAELRARAEPVVQALSSLDLRYYANATSVLTPGQRQQLRTNQRPR